MDKIARLKEILESSHRAVFYRRRCPNHADPLRTQQ